MVYPTISLPLIKKTPSLISTPTGETIPVKSSSSSKKNVITTSPARGGGTSVEMATAIDITAKKTTPTSTTSPVKPETPAQATAKYAKDIKAYRENIAKEKGIDLSRVTESMVTSQYAKTESPSTKKVDYTIAKPEVLEIRGLTKMESIESSIYSSDIYKNIMKYTEPIRLTTAGFLGLAQYPLSLVYEPYFETGRFSDIKTTEAKIYRGGLMAGKVAILETNPYTAIPTEVYFGSTIGKSFVERPVGTLFDIGRYIWEEPYEFYGGLKGAKIGKEFKMPLTRQDILLADVGELVPLKERIKQVQRITEADYLETITGKRNIKTYKPSNPKAGNIEYTYNIPFEFATYKIKDIYPSSELFLTTKIKPINKGGIEIRKTKVAESTKKYGEFIQTELLTKGKVPEPFIEKYYKEVRSEADILKEPLGAISPKRLRGFPQAEQELIKILPEKYTAKETGFAGYTPKTIKGKQFKVYTEKSFIKNIPDIITSKIGKTGRIYDYWKEIAFEKTEYLKGRKTIMGEYGFHGREHLLPMEKYGKFYPYHDITKVGDVESFAKYPHGETASELVKRGKFPEESIYKISKKEQRLIAEAFAGHEYARFNIKSLFTKPEKTGFKSLTFPSKKQIYYSAKAIKNPMLRDISTLDRLDLPRIGKKVDVRFLSIESLERLGLKEKGKPLEMKSIYKKLDIGKQDILKGEIKEKAPTYEKYKYKEYPYEKYKPIKTPYKSYISSYKEIKIKPFVYIKTEKTYPKSYISKSYKISGKPYNYPKKIITTKEITTISPTPFEEYKPKKKFRTDNSFLFKPLKESKKGRLRDDYSLTPSFTARQLGIRQIIKEKDLFKAVSRGKTGFEIRGIPVIR